MFLDVRKSKERRASKKFYKKCPENSRSQIVFRTDILREFKLGALISRRHHWFPQEMTFGEERPYWWRVTTQIWESEALPIRSTTQIWVATLNQYQFLERHYAGKPVVASHNVSCFLRLTDMSIFGCFNHAANILL